MFNFKLIKENWKTSIRNRLDLETLDLNQIRPKSPQTLELSVKSLKEKRNHGLDPSLRTLHAKRSLTCCILEPILKVG